MTPFPMHVHYRRQLAGADFSLEANTEATPEAGHFYLLQGGEVLLRSDDFSSADAAYQQLCHAYWEHQLGSADADVRRKSALGLLGQDLGHVGATGVLRRDGSDADRARIERARCKKRARERATGWRGRSTHR